ncbi:MAG TPA: thiamine pyrophosphate-dependent enzyme [Methanotrichaceae archaeon]|nr:thiamine pyrophosphate-dependent enzyme [Methanotrichaceae archaeon]
MKQELNGTEAIDLAARDCRVEARFYVPGYPITDLARVLEAEISVNEKVAMEMALGASATGSRSMVIAKQLGMNLLADPLVISATHTIGAGLMVLVGDDLGPRGSQAEMDSRYYGLICELPVLDPRDPESLYHSIAEAYSLSERIRAPAIVRITSRLLSARGQVDPGLDELQMQMPHQYFDRSIWKLTAMGRHQRYRREVLPTIESASESTPLNSIRITDQVGVIASGYPARLAEGLGCSLLAMGYANPLPWNLVQRFIDGHRLVLVAEEPEPLIESQLRMSDKVLGRMTGHLPFGSLSKEDLSTAIEGISEDLGKAQIKLKLEPPAPDYESAREKGHKTICDGCPFEPLFAVLGRLDVPVAGDAGCSINSVREPYSSVDMAYGLGSAIGVASGFKRKGIAVIGDYALAHSGLQGLINAVWRGKDVLVVVIQNGVAAQTGCQEVPDLTGVLEALVPMQMLNFPVAEEGIEQLLRDELAKPGTSMVMAIGRCVMDDRH